MKMALALATLLGGASSAFAGTSILINEVDADTPGTDDAEFIELYDGGVGNSPLDGLVVVLYNGSDDQSYNDAIDLDGFSTDANGYFVIGSALVPNVDLVAFTTNGIQNGADAVALYVGNAVDFPNDTPITTANLVDALVYDTNDGDDAGLLVLLNAGQPQINEGAVNSSEESNGRCGDGTGGALNTDTYLQGLPTPGEPNACTVVLGACCNELSGVCIDDATEAECQGPDDVFYADLTCLDVECMGTPIGACCNEFTGVCTDDVTEADCLASAGVWGGADSLCADVTCEMTVEPANVLISEIVDATLPSGLPKFVEITNCDTVDVDLAFYSIGNFNNGGTTLGGGASAALSGMLAPGESFVYSYSSDTDPTFTDVYGFPPSAYAGGGFVNGDDVIALYFGVATGDGSDALLLDVYGVIGVDGSGEVWEYTDGYAFRTPGSGPNPTFDATEWNYSGANGLETGDDKEELALILELTTPFVHTCGSACYDLDDDGQVSFGDLLIVLSSWGECEMCDADLDGSGAVNFNDLLILLASWGPCV